MISVTQAQQIVLQAARPCPAATWPLSPDLLGRVLAEDVASDMDVPPHDMSMMDGYAVRSSDLASGTAILQIVEEITAGQVPRQPVAPGQATRIMTGAPVPAGADAVVQVERTTTTSVHQVKMDDRPPRTGQNILRRATAMRQGEIILRAGAVLRPQEIGVLATVGRATVRIHPAPRVAVLSTGDELVDPAETPGPGQIRNGNGPTLTAQVCRAGGIPRFLGIARDEPGHLRTLISQGLECSVLVMSGGVSAGKLDLVPGTLQELGVQPHFHKVEMKPGKPVFFGTREGTLVFGLPGNPVSAVVCFELFVRPALRRLAGHADAGPRVLEARLAEDFVYRTDRPTYHPAWLDVGPEGWRVRPVPWFGSADLRGLTQANALVLFLPDQDLRRAGQHYTVVPTDSV